MKRGRAIDIGVEERIGKRVALSRLIDERNRRRARGRDRPGRREIAKPGKEEVDGVKG